MDRFFGEIRGGNDNLLVASVSFIEGLMMIALFLSCENILPPKCCLFSATNVRSTCIQFESLYSLHMSYIPGTLHTQYTHTRNDNDTYFLTVYMLKDRR